MADNNENINRELQRNDPTDQYSDTFQYFNNGDIVEKSRQTVTDGMLGDEGTIISFVKNATQTADSSSHYFQNIYDASNTGSGIQFAVSYGNINGYSGSGNNVGIYDTSYGIAETIYGQYSNKILSNLNSNTTEQFVWANNSSSVDFFSIAFSNNVLKESLDEGNWELRLKSGSKTIKLVDDSTSNTVSYQDSNVGPVYNIVSGSFVNSVKTTYATSSAGSPYGKVYPALGVMLFNPQQIQLANGNAWDYSGSVASSMNEVIDRFYKLIGSGSYFAARNEEIISSMNYFVRVNNAKFNFSNNPTWQSGSNGIMKYTEMWEDPISYITTVGLYNNDNELIAIAKLSKPVKKSFEEELLLKVRLDF